MHWGDYSIHRAVQHRREQLWRRSTPWGHEAGIHSIVYPSKLKWPSYSKKLLSLSPSRSQGSGWSHTLLQWKLTFSVCNRVQCSAVQWISGPNVTFYTKDLMWCKEKETRKSREDTRGVTRVRIPVQLLVFSQAHMAPWARAKAQTCPSIQSIVKQMCCPIYPLNLIMRDINNWSEGLDPDSSTEVGSSHVAVVAKYTMWIFGFSGSLGRINPKRQQGQGLLWFQGNNIKHMPKQTH